jgi:hypothetical protein
MLFGGIHCLGWNFLFPGYVEQQLWRVASIWIAYLFGVIMWCYLAERLWKSFTRRGPVSPSHVTTLTVIGYISARLIIIVLMVLSLRSLPPGVYDTVAWTQFIPHW